MSTTEIIAQLTDQAKSLGRETPTDAELADAIGDVRAVEVRLADVRHRWETLTAEMDQIIDHQPERRINANERAGAPVAVGQRWEVVPNYKTDRTFNPDAILVAVEHELSNISGATIGLDRVLRYLTREGAVTIGWKITGVRRVFAKLGIPLRTQPEPIEGGDIDGAHVGEYLRQSGVTRVPIKESIET